MPPPFAAGVSRSDEVIPRLLLCFAESHPRPSSPCSALGSTTAGEGHEAVCRTLLEARADVGGWPDGIPPGQPGEVAPTALELAERCGHVAVCALLRSYGALEAAAALQAVPGVQHLQQTAQAVPASA